jgi:hypothetical protein
MEVCSQRVGCEQRVAHMHRQKSGLESFCRWGVANRGCELGALRPSPAGLKAASVARSNSTVTQIEAVPGPSLLPGRVHLTHVSRNWPVRRFAARSQSPSKLSSPSPIVSLAPLTATCSVGAWLGWG